MITQREYVEGCQQWYKEADLQPGNPEDGEWHECHYPVPKCLGGTETILLLKEHHAVQGVLQSEEYQHPCIWGWERKYCKGVYGELYRKWKHNHAKMCHATRDPEKAKYTAKSNLDKRTEEQKQEGLERSHKKCKELGLGIWDPEAAKRGRETRWERDRIPIILVHPDGKEEWWRSAQDAAKAYQLQSQNLNHVLKNRRKRVQGFTARYAN
jgi:hypothetical protein